MDVIHPHVVIVAGGTMKGGTYRILVINPGSTSTKVAIFENEAKAFSDSVTHDQEVLKQFTSISDQLMYRKKTIDNILHSDILTTEKIDACVGRCGSVLPVVGGTYKVSPMMLEHAAGAVNGVHHPAMLGIQLASLYAQEFGCDTYTVNPPEVDEFQELARITGIKGIRRQSHLHALNLKETAIHHAKLMKEKYEEKNYIVCHVGGGISVSAHRKGRMIDGNDIAFGVGPMAPTRCGSIPVADIIDLCFSGVKKEDVKKYCTTEGGLVSLLGTSDAREVKARADAGDCKAQEAWEAIIYQITKHIGAMAAVLEGKVDGILLSGGLIYNEAMVIGITEACSFIGNVYAYPGEFEMEALSQGCLRVLRGEEIPADYDSQAEAYLHGKKIF
ncbi:MAG: butyrate kinase [Anaerovoracaceae bacterium]